MFRHATRRSLAERLIAALERCRAGRRVILDAEGMRPRFRRLAEWQSRRLRHTYRDLFASDRHRMAVEFFLADLYGPRDYTARDEGFERVQPIMVKVLPDHAILTICRGVELHALTQELDMAMADALFRDRGPGDEPSATDYAEAYRRVGRAPDRQRQVELIGIIGRALEELVRKPLIYSAIRMARRPARTAGLGELQDFIERGFRAFREMGSADHFLAVITERETRIMESILSGGDAAEWAAGNDAPGAPTDSGRPVRSGTTG